MNAKNWWWKNLLSADKDGSQAAAFHYELGRRNFPLAEYPAFTKLKRGELNIVYLTFGRKFARWSVPPVLIIKDTITSTGDFVSFPIFFWNLRASKNALLQSFWKKIEDERERRHIPEPQAGKTGKGSKSRNSRNAARTKGGGQPWRWLELLDVPHGLSSNDRSHLSAARNKMATLKNDFLLLWREIEQHRKDLNLCNADIPNRFQNPDSEPVKWKRRITSIFN